MTALTAQPLETADGAQLKSVVEYLPFVRKVAHRVARRLPAHITLDDLVGAGVVGLIEAMGRYDPTKVSDFEKYAEFRVKGSILDELRRRDLMARDARLEAKQIQQTIEGLTQEVGRQPEEDEIAERLGIDVTELRTKLEKLTPVKVMSFNEVHSDTMPGTVENPFEQYAKKEMIERLQQALGKLGERYQQVLFLYYQESLTLKEIGEVLDVSESRVCQIMSEATLRLRVLLGVEKKKAETKRRKVAGE